MPIRATIDTGLTHAQDELSRRLRVLHVDDVLAHRLKRAVADEVKLLALTLDERALTVAALEDRRRSWLELRAVLLADHQWRRAEGLD